MDLEGDTLVMASELDSHAVVLTLGSVCALEINQRVTHMGRYAGIGLLVGAGIGALIGVSARPTDDLFSPGTDALVGAYLFGIPGAVIGFLAGSRGSQRWIPLDPAKLRLTWQPDGRGATVSTLIRF